MKVWESDRFCLLHTDVYWVCCCAFEEELFVVSVLLLCILFCGEHGQRRKDMIVRGQLLDGKIQNEV